MEYVIGLDGGGTNTHAVAFDLAGNILHEQVHGFANVLIDAEVAIANIIQAIYGCQKALPESICKFIFLGLAGIESGTHRPELERELEKFGIPFKITNDAVIAHAAALDGNDGILAIAGTGSVIYGKRENKFEMIGGWGHLLGDEGSGYYIVIQYMKHMISQFEVGLAQSDLTKKILAKIGKVNVVEIKSFIYTKSKAEIADLTPIIVEAAKNGDEQAMTILAMAVDVLVKQTLLLATKMNFDGEIKIGLKGSILTKIAIINKLYRSNIHEIYPHAKFIQGDSSSPKGAFYLALAELKNGDNHG